MPPPADLSSVAATVAHELVAPLAIIASAASLLKREGPGERDPAEVDEIVRTIERNVAHAQIVVEALRTLDADGEDLHLAARPTDLNELVTTTVHDLEATVLRHHPTDVVDHGIAAVAQVDPPRIRQVLFNLLSNAAKFSPAGRTVTVELRAPSEGTVEVVVRDQGHGVAPDDAERIFQKWERADPGTRGLGLGLHLARAIARAHGGDLELEPATDDEGAVFVLSLPTA
ncbi:MAG: HAMP domain-containing histidine kinase [Actinobacteria bacterium]|nr:HAMP domain-containing histidine kinase [Actinomycetota bacterium]